MNKSEMLQWKQNKKHLWGMLGKYSVGWIESSDGCARIWAFSTLSRRGIRCSDEAEAKQFIEHATRDFLQEAKEAIPSPQVNAVREKITNVAFDYFCIGHTFNFGGDSNPKSAFERALKQYPIKEHLSLLPEQVETRSELIGECIKIMRRYWTFDEGQQHTHSWHSFQDCIEKLELLKTSKR